MRQPLDPEPFLPPRPNWFHIMAVLADGEQHSYAIMQQIELSERPGAADDDARRRYYRLTPLGHAVLSAEVTRLRELVRFAAASVRKADGNV